MLDQLCHRPHRAGLGVAFGNVLLHHRQGEVAADRRDVRGLDAGIGEVAAKRLTRVQLLRRSSY